MAATTATAASVLLKFPVVFESQKSTNLRSVFPLFRGHTPSRIYCNTTLRIRPSRCMYSAKDTIDNTFSSQVGVEDDVDDEACELVNGVELILGEGDDAIRAYLLKAVKNNNGTGVLLLSDIFGFEDSSTRDFAYRIACSGYNVLVPDLFRGNPWKKDSNYSKFDTWLMMHPADRVTIDIDTSAGWMINEFIAAGMSKKLGIIGFCFGGRYVVNTLARDKEASFGTGICFYGVNINKSLASDINVPVLFISGDKDSFCPVDILHEMEKSIEGSKVLIYHDRGHGFAHRPESQEDDDDAENAFSVTRNWLHDFLVVNR